MGDTNWMKICRCRCVGASVGTVRAKINLFLALSVSAWRSVGGGRGSIWEIQA